MTMPFATEHPFTTDQDISSTVFWDQPFAERDKTFAWLRANAPVSWHPPLENPALPADVHGEKGFWAVTRAEEIRYVSQNQDIFSSAVGGVEFRPRDPALPMPPSFLEMDPPEHTHYRQIMSAAFTPKAVKRLTAQIEERAEKIVGAVAGAGDFDFVERVAAKLPMLTVADMVGVPESLTEEFARAGDDLISAMGGGPPEGANLLEYMFQQMTVLRQIGVDLVEHRRKHPADDIATALATARIDGRPLSEDDIQSLMVLLSVAGNDTTKQTTSWTAYSLDRNPDQRAWLAEDFDGRIMASIEEFVRHASPVVEFARTATRDTELAGQKITAGDKVVIFYCSGNRDESVFPDPHKFDLTRPRSAHVGFGGGGVHFCLGNGVAKAQLRALFRQILTKLPDLRITGEPALMRSEFINGVTHLPASTR
ncbi:cytochrome P450 [Streptomyces sp. NPDC005760]|uniref:cytochrome P450 n=1 Tax=Streptomyces sp. NPDC005760 TaxID=3156718 RepID=UPI0033F5284E